MTKEEYAQDVLAATITPGALPVEIDAGYISDDKRLVGKRMERVYYHIEDTGRERLKILLEDYSATTIAIQTVLAYHPTKEKESRRKKD